MKYRKLLYKLRNEAENELNKCFLWFNMILVVYSVATLPNEFNTYIIVISGWALMLYIISFHASVEGLDSALRGVINKDNLADKIVEKLNLVMVALTNASIILFIAKFII